MNLKRFAAAAGTVAILGTGTAAAVAPAVPAAAVVHVCPPLMHYHGTKCVPNQPLADGSAPDMYHHG